MPVYVVVYRQPDLGEHKHLRWKTDVTGDFMAAVSFPDAWPYDVADDPSFYCAERFRHQGGQLTWGICRRDLRNRLIVGDVVVFIAYSRTNSEHTYRFSGFGTVSGLISGADVWTLEHSVYQNYLNLFAVVKGQQVRHYEPQPSEPHPDWLWRMTTSKGHHWRANDFKKEIDADSVDLGLTRVQGELIDLAPNYVIFSDDPNKTFILREPLEIATARRHDKTNYRETWGSERRSQSLMGLAIVRGAKRGLRTSWTGFQHVHLRLQHEPARWRSEALEVFERWDLSNAIGARCAAERTVPT
jgi:hypothetical protein